MISLNYLLFQNPFDDIRDPLDANRKKESNQHEDIEGMFLPPLSLSSLHTSLLYYSELVMKLLIIALDHHMIPYFIAYEIWYGLLYSVFVILIITLHVPYIKRVKGHRIITY